MGFFDLFKRKKTEPKVEEPKVVAPEVKEQVVQETPAVTETPAIEVAVEEKPQEEIAPQAVEETPQVAEPQTVVAEPEDDDEPNIEEERKELEEGLGKTKEGFFGRLKRAIAGRTTVDADVLDDLEEVLITSDVGVETTVKIIEAIEARVARDKYMNTSELNDILREEIARLMEESHRSTKDFGIEVKEGYPYVMMVVGVNGAGKTTTIGKLAAKLTRAGRKV